MIKEHEFNSKWWGKPVGVVVDAGFFGQSDEEIARQLSPFDWVEYKASHDRPVDPYRLHKTGFFWADLRATFRISLSRVGTTPSLDALDVESAADNPFVIESGEVSPFVHERFQRLLFVSQSDVDRRYILWSRQIIEEHPSWCIAVTREGELQGWFLSQASPRGLNLTLAMLCREASISGAQLYHKAMNWYGRHGAGLGWADFSLENTAVHNIYAHLGARFTAPVSCWLWRK